MAAKKKTSKVLKVGVIHCTDNSNPNNWFAKDPDDPQRLVNPPFGPKLAPINTLQLPSAKIVVVVAENPSWTDDDSGVDVRRSKKLECGRAGAQAAHAVSKLKLSYVMWYSQRRVDQAYSFLVDVMGQPITTIIVKARDTEELLHICRLARSKNLHTVDFYDDNEKFYGTDQQVMTAVAIGPYTGCELNGITDYLPLWKCGCD